MSFEMAKCRITVLKRTLNQDLIDEYLDDAYKDTGLCECFEEGEGFVIDPFVVPEDFNVDEFMQSSFGVFQGEPENIKIWFSSDVAGYIRERIWHQSQQIHPQDDGSIIFEAEVAGTDEIKYWIMNWGSKAVALSPETLREEIQEEAALLMKNYRNEPFLPLDP